MTAKDDIILNLLIISNFGVFCGLNSGRVLIENRKLASSENYETARLRKLWHL